MPLGKRVVTGCVVAHAAAEDAPEALAAEVKDIHGVLDHESFLPPAVVELCTWVADYYMAGIGDAVGVALPPGARERASSYKTHRVITATAHGLEAAMSASRLKRAPTTEGLAPAPTTEGTATEPSVGAGFSRLTSTALGEPRTKVEGLKPGSRQLTALQEIAASPTGLPASELRSRGIGSDVIARLRTRGLVSVTDDRDERDPFEGAVCPTSTDPARELTVEQRDALDQLTALAKTDEFRAAVLHGVTGSGKTEIYLRLADQICRAGRQVLLLVPEIALTPSMAAQFRGAFGSRVAIQHSGLSQGERHDQWQRIRRGDVDVVVGTRSAVFAPLERIGLIVVDEEHDSSYKQEESPRYHGRDVAIVRASTAGALVVLGSATPSMESFQNAMSGKYAHVALERRVLDRPLAAVTVVNMREEIAEEGPDVVISRALSSAIEARLTRREQVVVLLNRRGFSTAVFCRQCGDTFDCPNCSVSLTVHSIRGRAPQSPIPNPQSPTWRARCHYCNYSVVVPVQCRKCAAPYLDQAGFGTEKVEQQLRERFPEARIGRVDRDSVRRRGTLAALLGKFAQGELDILVGTQMIAKGHDFPRVTLVGVISADVGLGLADFRAAERTFQLLTQVAGRAGRGERAGEAIVQTLFPEHYSVQLACRQDFGAFFEHELKYRRGLRYPPMVAMINTVVRGRTFDAAMTTAREIVGRLAPASGTGGFVILGPAPAPLARLRGEHRVQFFLKGTRRAAMREALKIVLDGLPEVRRRVTVDVDPLSVL